MRILLLSLLMCSAIAMPVSVAFIKGVNPKLHESYKRIKKDKSVHFQNYKIVLVRGLLTDHYRQWVNSVRFFLPVIPENTFNVFFDQLKWFEENGIEVEEAPISTNASSQENGEILQEYLREQEKDILLVTHSKGGIDSLFGYLGDPSSFKKVKGWVALQVPFFGTPLIDCVTSCPGISSLSSIPAFFLGAENLLDGLHSEDLRNYMEKNDSKIRKLTQNINFLSVTSYFESTPWKFWQGPSQRSFMEPTNVLLTTLGEANDGLLPTVSACLPHSPCLVVDNVDHGMFVMPSAPYKGLSTKERVQTLNSFLNLVVSDGHK